MTKTITLKTTYGEVSPISWTSCCPVFSDRGATFVKEPRTVPSISQCLTVPKTLSCQNLFMNQFFSVSVAMSQPVRSVFHPNISQPTTFRFSLLFIRCTSCVSRPFRFKITILLLSVCFSLFIQCGAVCAVLLFRSSCQTEIVRV